MCSIRQQSHGSSAARLAVLSKHSLEVSAEIAEMLADPDVIAELAAIPGDVLPEHVVTLLASADRATASATVLTGTVEATSGRSAGTLIAGRYASTSRFLEVEAGLSAASARAIVGRARDLREDYVCVTDPWLSGAVTSDAVREVTVGVRTALKHSGLPAAEREVARKAALDLVLPVAERSTVADVKRVISHLKLVTNPDGDLAPEEQLSDGVDPESWDGRRRARERYDHLLAIAFGEAFTSLLDNNDVGSHHGIAPHVTLTVDVERFEAGLGGDLTMPGSDEPVFVPNATVERILCDADITTVITRALTPAASDGSALGLADADRCTKQLASLLLEASREVLYVGRAQRVVPPRLRRALEARDRHCAFPGGRAHVRRCHAHHVKEWEHGGGTDEDNMILLCVRHHHAVHEGGWTITRAAGIPPGGTG